jgi:hypothetical protein
MKFFDLFLIAVLMFTSMADAQDVPGSRATTPQMSRASQAEKVREEVNKRGSGEKSRVRIKMHDNSEIKGYIGQIEVGSFTVVDKTGLGKSVQYDQVQTIQGPGLSRGAKIGIVIGAGVIVVVAVFLIGLRTHGY